jgi:CheY-like chemotaxis protein
MIDIRTHVEVPVAFHATTSQEKPAMQVAGNAQPPLVLVVEDHPSIRNVLSCVLNLQGFQTICTTNGQEALNWLESAHHTGKYPAVILLDLVMPVMNGEAFLEQMRSYWQAPTPIPPVILFTVDQGDHANLACAEVLSKPFHIKDLLEKLERLLKGVQTTQSCQV